MVLSKYLLAYCDDVLQQLNRLPHLPVCLVCSCKLVL